jgi:hypothetical protein
MWVESISGCELKELHPGRMVWYQGDLYLYEKKERKSRRSPWIGFLKGNGLKRRVSLDTRVIPAIRCKDASPKQEEG